MKKIHLNKGDRYGTLKILGDGIKHIQPNGSTKSTYVCECDCGKIITVQMFHLKSGHTKNCGCKKVETSRLAGQKYFTHGQWKGNKPTAEWLAWHSMKNRCYNKNHKDFKNWGEKGVIVCERWLTSFENFFNDMGSKPSSKHSLDRINPFGNYEPSNCRWATSKQQANNKRIHHANI